MNILFRLKNNEIIFPRKKVYTLLMFTYYLQISTKL